MTNESKPAPLAATVIATWFGCGFSPVAPGTAGSLGALVPVLLLERWNGFRPWHLGLLAAAALAPAVWSADRESRARLKKDPGLVVVDEVVGMWVTLAGATTLNWKSVAAGFLLFRLFDIWKPAPARQLESLPGGYGIVADDLMAGLYGALVLLAAGCFNFY